MLQLYNTKMLVPEEYTGSEIKETDLSREDYRESHEFITFANDVLAAMGLKWSTTREIKNRLRKQDLLKESWLQDALDKLLIDGKIQRDLRHAYVYKTV